MFNFADGPGAADGLGASDDERGSGLSYDPRDTDDLMARISDVFEQDSLDFVPRGNDGASGRGSLSDLDFGNFDFVPPSRLRDLLESGELELRLKGTPGESEMIADNTGSSLDDFGIL